MTFLIHAPYPFPFHHTAIPSQLHIHIFACLVVASVKQVSRRGLRLVGALPRKVDLTADHDLVRSGLCDHTNLHSLVNEALPTRPELLMPLRDAQWL